MPELVFVHGFTQTSESWKPVLEKLRSPRPSTCVDLPAGCDIKGAAEVIANKVGRAVYIGYSMGARIALQLAVDRPEMAEALVLIGATPGIEDPVERAARQRSDEQLALTIEADGVEAFLDRWLAHPMFAGLGDPMKQDRMRNSTETLASHLRLMGTGNMEPLWDHLDRIRCPVLLVTGSADNKFRNIALRMQRLLPDARIASIEGAGHAAHLEKPHEFTKYLEAFLETEGLRTSTNPSTG